MQQKVWIVNEHWDTGAHIYVYSSREKAEAHACYRVAQVGGTDEQKRETADMLNRHNESRLHTGSVQEAVIDSGSKAEYLQV